MKRFLILIALFLVAGSVTAVGYALFQVGMIGKTGDQTPATSASSTTSTPEKTKDLSWMQEIKGLSNTTSTNEETTASATSTDDLAFVASTSTDVTTSTQDLSQTSTNTTSSDQHITDLGKSDALTSSIYDYAFKALVLSAEIRHGTVFLTWTPATNESFTGYKVLKSTADENPYLPKSSSIKSISDVTVTAYTDGNVSEGTTYYYRICMTKKGKPPACGNILQVSL